MSVANLISWVFYYPQLDSFAFVYGIIGVIKYGWLKQTVYKLLGHEVNLLAYQITPIAIIIGIILLV